jgi:DNA invertase Pin-like site-specific DNA recombinase
MINQLPTNSLTSERPQALLYLRCGSGHQADRDRAIVAQQHICTRRAEELGAVVVGEFLDLASGLNGQRPGMTAMLARLRSLHEVRQHQRIYVITADHARIGRSVQAYSHVSYEIDRAGGLINIASVALAEYEALMRWPNESNTDGLPPPEPS